MEITKIGKRYALYSPYSKICNFEECINAKMWVNFGDKFEDLEDDGGFLKSKKRAVLSKEGDSIIVLDWHSFRISEEDNTLFFKVRGDEKEWSTKLSQLGFYINSEMRD